LGDGVATGTPIKLFEPGGEAKAQEPRRLTGGVDEAVRRIGRNVDGFAGANKELLAGEGTQFLTSSEPVEN
jgi:hypothetical protein